MALSLPERADLLTVLLAREIDDESIVVMGTGTPLTAVATLLALRHHAPRAHYTSPLAGGLSVRPHELTLAEMERAVYEHALMRSAQIIELWETATINPHTQRRWLQFFRPAQMDAMGNINNSVIGDYRRPRVRLPGSVGISDMAAYYHRLYAYVTRHVPAAFPERVDFVSAPGTLGSAAERERRGLRWGRPFRVFTDLCVLEFDEEGRMVVASVHPRTTIDEVRAATGFPLELRSQEVTPPPSESELAALREVDPNGLRRLELLPSRERREIIFQALRGASPSYRVPRPPEPDAARG